MTRFILIRHANVTIDKDKPASDWQMSPDSQTDCDLLARQIDIYDVQHIYTSTEQKAIQTGAVIAAHLSIQQSITNNLHETERKSAQFYDSQDEFRQAIHEAMANPTSLVFGDETFSDAKIRFHEQLAKLAERHPNETIAVVSHGRLLSMFLGEVMDADPTTIWDNLRMPAYAILDWETQYISKLAYEIDDVVIRFVQSHDIEQLPAIAEKALMNQYAESELASETILQRLVDKVYTVDAFEQALVSEHRHILVAEQDNAIVGFCQYGIPLMDDCDCEDLREIHSLFVLPDADDVIRDELIYTLEDTINYDATVQRLSVFVNPAFLEQVKFYARLGFHHQQAEDLDDLWYMELNL